MKRIRSIVAILSSALFCYIAPLEAQKRCTRTGTIDQKN